LEAKPGDVFDEWTITRRLGTGSTSRAFLAERDGHKEVLKVALSDAKVSRLQHEAQVLAPLMDSRVIRLAREEPVRIGGRWALVLEHVEDATQERRSDPTLARKLRDDGRLTVDELETYSEYLFGALDYLEGEGVYHRDIKPDNIAIRVRPNRTRQLVLFDFSLAGVSVKELQAGTPRYLDPFIGTTPRPVYDRHAEWYALAVTLHEMASGELPVWGDGVTEPRFTEGPPVLAAEAFDPAIRDGLASFFVRALDRDAARRFESLKEMRNAWLQVFAQSDRTAPVGSTHPATDEDEEASPEVREAAAAAATPETPLDASGLTPRAVSAAQRLEAVTVGDLLNKAPTLLFKTPGLGAKTRRELQQRVKQWRARLHVPTASPGTKVNRDAAKEEVDRAHGGELRTVGLDAIAALLTPAATSSNTTTVQAIRLLLRLPDDSGALPDLAPWPTQPAVAKAIGVTPGRVAQILTKQRKRWHDEPVMLQVRQELIEMLADSGRVMGAAELAASLLARRGCAQDDEAARLAVALAAVRAGVEVDALEGQRRLLTRRHSDPDRLLIALEVDDQEESADTPAGPALLDYADALGQAADRLAGMDVLPSPGTVMRVLAEAPAGPGISLSERRLVRLAAAASRHAAASPRLEIYPRELDLVRALRLAQAGVVSPELPGDDSRRSGVRPEDVKARVRARFPDMTTKLPDHPVLH
ncbi:MAG: protein kinase domain-containing protein, partial [Micromonosporaceae bacterium]